MESTITPEEIEKMKAFLKEHPVDPQYDGLLDGDIPTEQDVYKRQPVYWAR